MENPLLLLKMNHLRPLQHCTDGIENHAEAQRVVSCGGKKRPKMPRRPLPLTQGRDHALMMKMCPWNRG
jgi:hypothetical protein